MASRCDCLEFRQIMSPPRNANSIKTRSEITSVIVVILNLHVMSHDDEDFDLFAFLLMMELFSPGIPIRPIARHCSSVDRYSEAECWHFFRFRKHDLNRLLAVLRFPPTIHAGNGTHTSIYRGEEGLLLLLRRMASPCRLVDLIDEFGLFESELSYLFNWSISFVYTMHSHLLDSLHVWIPHVPAFAAAVASRSGVSALYCWSFVDGTIRAIARPIRGQQSQYKYFIFLANQIIYFVLTVATIASTG